MNMRRSVVKRCLLTLTEEQFQFDQAAHKAVKVYGILNVSVATDDGLQHSTVDMETCDRKKSIIPVGFLTLFQRCSLYLINGRF